MNRRSTEFQEDSFAKQPRSVEIAWRDDRSRWRADATLEKIAEPHSSKSFFRPKCPLALLTSGAGLVLASMRGLILLSASGFRPIFSGSAIYWVARMEREARSKMFNTFARVMRELNYGIHSAAQIGGKHLQAFVRHRLETLRVER